MTNDQQRKGTQLARAVETLPSHPRANHVRWNKEAELAAAPGYAEARASSGAAHTPAARPYAGAGRDPEQAVMKGGSSGIYIGSSSHGVHGDGRLAGERGRLPINRRRKQSTTSLDPDWAGGG
jgi:hypothetical protein